MTSRRLPPLAAARVFATGGLLAALVLGPGVSFAEPLAGQPLISGYGKTVAVENAGERPDPTLDYKLVMSVTEAGPDGSPAPALDTAARLVNLLAQSGVPAGHRHIVLVLHGPATMAVLDEAGLKARGLSANPSASLIAKLADAGVSVRVCGQALAAAKIAQSEVMPQVQVDLSAVTTLSTLQMRGYALLPE
jgi:intracellular sulfur oxidation DsrE/DsrF family protein